jgi:hypothetical protein
MKSDLAKFRELFDSVQCRYKIEQLGTGSYLHEDENVRDVVMDFRGSSIKDKVMGTGGVTITFNKDGKFKFVSGHE